MIKDADKRVVKICSKSSYDSNIIGIINTYSSIPNED